MALYSLKTQGPALLTTLPSSFSGYFPYQLFGSPYIRSDIFSR